MILRGLKVGAVDATDRLCFERSSMNRFFYRDKSVLSNAAWRVSGSAVIWRIFFDFFVLNETA